MTAADQVSLTLSEAVYVVGRFSVVINKAIDRGVIRAAIDRSGTVRSRKLGPAELRF